MKVASLANSHNAVAYSWEPELGSMALDDSKSRPATISTGVGEKAMDSLPKKPVSDTRHFPSDSPASRAERRCLIQRLQQQ